MRKLIVVSLALTAFSVRAELINFDNAGLFQPDIITNFYSGVTFNGLDNPFPIGPGPYPSPATVPVSTQDTVIWRAPAGSSSPNMAVGVTSAGEAEGGILMTFDQLISSLSLVGLDFGDNVQSNDSEEISLTAYDAAGNLIGQNHFTTKLPGYADAVFGEISFANMKYVAFNYTNTNFGFYGIDDLMFTPAVPVPAAAWLFGSGLSGLLVMLRMKANRQA